MTCQTTNRSHLPHCDESLIHQPHNAVALYSRAVGPRQYSQEYFQVTKRRRSEETLSRRHGKAQEVIATAPRAEEGTQDLEI